MSNKEVMFYEKVSTNDETNSCKCKLCPHNCYILPGQYGHCNLRKNENGILFATNYGEVTSANIDPIEKKPLYHFKPGKNILSLGTYGCNMTCSFCQNYAISQNKPQTQYVPIESLIDVIESTPNNAGIAFTYNEPFMWYEYIYDAVKKIKSNNKDISVVLVTNGYINEEPLKRLLPYIDAMNIDLKAFTNTYYNTVCGATIEPVLKTIELSGASTHVEITTLMVTGENDSDEHIKGIAEFISSINKDIPLHISRYFPTYKMSNPPTSIDNILKGYEVAKKYLNYVYVGNVADIDNNTYCPYCNEPLVIRNGYHTQSLINTALCPNCNKPVHIVF